MLENPGFETGSGTAFSNWVSWGSAFRETATNRSGSCAAKLYAPGGPSEHYSGLYQDEPAAVEQLWRASGWILTRSDDPIQGDNEAFIRLEFYDENTNRLMHWDAPVKMTSSRPQDQWIYASVEARAPIGTAWARCQATFYRPHDDAGSAWFDDCSLASGPKSTLSFAGRNWFVRTWEGAPGIQPWSTNSAWVDGEGHLHLRLTESDGIWWAGEVISEEAFGYGEYRWYLSSRVDLYDTNIVGALFTYADPVQTRDVQYTNEIDIEFSKAFQGSGESNLVYSIQPYDAPGNQCAEMMDLTNILTTHRIIWNPGEVKFDAYYGHSSSPPEGDIFGEWTYALQRVPLPSNENVRMSIWLFDVLAPADTQYLELVVEDFTFTPFDGDVASDEFNDFDKDAQWNFTGIYGDPSPVVEENGACLRVKPTVDWQTCGYLSAQTINWNDRGLRFVFSALLSSVSVTSARSGEDLRTILSLASEKDNGWTATNSVILQGRYDENNDTLTFVLFTKTNWPSAEGNERFNGTLSNACSYLGSGGGIDMRIVLGDGEYILRLSDACGHPLPVSTNTGALRGAHNLGDSLCNAWWLVGAQSAESGRGNIYWDRAWTAVSRAPCATLDAAGQTSTNGEGLVTIECSIADCDKDFCRIGLEGSTNGGQSWFRPWLTVMTSSCPAVLECGGEPFQMLSVATTNAAGAGATNTICLTWATQHPSNEAVLANGVHTDVCLRTFCDDHSIEGPTLTCTPFAVDNLAPDTGPASVTITNAGAYTYAPCLGFTYGGFTDSLSQIARHYASFTDGGGTTSGTLMPQSPGSLCDPALDQTNHVYVWAADAAGNLSPAVSDQIVVLSTNGDFDADGMDNTWEDDNSLDPTDGADAAFDGDEDGATNYEEYRAGTHPGDSNSVFEAAPVEYHDGVYRVNWPSATGRTYTVHRGTDLMESLSPLATNIPATPPANTYTDAAAGVEAAYYRVEVE